MKKPSICQLVVYHNPCCRAHGNKFVDTPAIVRRVNSNFTLDLFVCGPTPYVIDSVSAGGPEGDVPTKGCWTWPRQAITTQSPEDGGEGIRGILLSENVQLRALRDKAESECERLTVQLANRGLATHKAESEWPCPRCYMSGRSGRLHNLGSVWRCDQCGYREDA